MFAVGDTYRFEFTTSDPATGVLTDADSTPTGVLVVDGTDLGTTVTITDSGTGRYKGSVSLAGLSVGDVFYVRVSATVGAVAGEWVTHTERVDATGASVFSIPPVTANSLVLIARSDALTSNAYFIITEKKRFYSAEDNAWYNWSDVVVDDIKATVATTCARIDDDDSVNLPLLEAETILGSNLTAGVYDLVVFKSNDITQPEAGRFRVRWDGSVLYAIDSAIQTTLGTPAGASIAADIAGVDTALSPQPTALDKPAQLLRIARRFDGVIRSPDVVTIAPGETAEFGFEFKGRPRPHTAEEPTGVTETGLTAALVGVAPEWVSYSVAATDAAAVGTVDYAVCEVADKDGNVVQLVAEVRVKELHP